MVRISKHQLFCLMMLFQIGSTTLFALGIEAKQNAWLAILLGTIGGLGLIWVYTELQRLFPQNNFVEITIKLLGKSLGIPMAILYALYFFYKSSVILMEFSELILSSYLPRTPIIYIAVSLKVIIIIVSCSGVEVFGRTSEIALPITISFILISYLLIIITGKVDMRELTPVFVKDIKTVIGAAYPRILNFPFGEAFVFVMYYNYVDPKESVRKTSITSVIVSGLLITLSTVIIISVLGVEFAELETIPLLQVIKLINIGDILTNLDAIGVTIIFIGGFYKITIFFYGTILVTNTLLRRTGSKILIIFTAILVLVFARYFIESYEFSLWLGKRIHPLLMNTPLLVINPILLLGIAYLKIKNKSFKNNT